MNKLKISVILLFIILISSCYGPQVVNRNINKKHYPISYLYDSPQQKEKEQVNLSVRLHDNTDTTLMSRAIKDDGYTLFLLLFYTYKYDYTIYLGKNTVDPDLSSFFSESFLEESKRKGSYTLSDSTQPYDFVLDLSLEDYQVSTKHHASFLYIAGTYREWEYSASPSTGYLKIKASLRSKGGKELLNKEYQTEEFTEFISEKARNITVLEALMQNMSETLSECVRQNIELIIEDVNAAIESSKNASNQTNISQQADI